MTTHLNAHQGIHRVVSKPHVCLICKMGFTKASKLAEHLANQHQSYTSANVPVESLPIDSLSTSKYQKPINYAALPVNNIALLSNAVLHNTKNVIEIKKEKVPEAK